MWPFTKNISRPSREKITDDDRIYRLFELVHNNPEHQLRFYAQLATDAFGTGKSKKLPF